MIDMRVAAAVLGAAVMLALPSAAQTLPGSADQPKDVVLTPGAPTLPIVWGAKDAFQINHDLLHFTGEPAVQVEPDLLARYRQARDRSLASARSNMMQRYAAAREAQQSAVGAGAAPKPENETGR